VKIAARGRAMVRGRVVVFGRGDPVRGLVCKVLLDGASSDPRLPLPGGVVTDAQGRFELMAPAGVSALECRNGAGTTSSGAAVVTLAAEETRDVELAVVRPQAANPQWGKLTGALFEDSLIGAQVEAVVAGTPAQRAGLRAGDQVLAVDGAPVEGLTQNGILHLIYDRPVGATAGLTVARGADTLVVPVKVIAPAG